MAKVNPRLLARLQTATGLGRSRVYALISRRASSLRVPLHLGALAVAADYGIGLHRYATDEDLATLRATTADAVPLIVPRTPPPDSRDERATRPRVPARPSQRPARASRKDNVWVVAGRNMKARDATYDFLNAIGLSPLEWVHGLVATREGSPSIPKVLDKSFKQAAAVVVVFTPDDEARLQKEFLRPGDGAHERRLTGQARQNVVFEAGMAFASHPKRTILVELGDVRPFTNISGLHVVRIRDGGIAARQELATKLKAAGCDVDLTGSHWHTAGDFKGAMGSQRTRRRRRR